MLNIKNIRENENIVRKAIKDKQLDNKVDLDEVLKVDGEYVSILHKVESIRALRNIETKNISKVEGSERKDLIEKANKTKEELKELEIKLSNITGIREDLLKKIPNLIHESVPYGIDDSENVSIKKWGEPKKLDFPQRDHIELGKSLGIIDTEKASIVAGTRFTYLFGEATLMQFALIQFVFETLTDSKVIKMLAEQVGNPNFETFIPVLPPVMIRSEILDKMDRLEPKEERYVLDEDNLVLIGSAEHTMGPLHMDEMISKEQLPKRYIGYSTSFRREAGNYGKDVRGIFRVHQFDKLEMESFTSSQTGFVEQDFLVAVQEYIVQKLGIPYQVVMVCTGDMGKPDFRQIDIECWMPGQNKYRETHTSDYMTDYQSRRLNIKEKNGDFVHMNDATALAIGRTLIAILENYQLEDGSVKVPNVLQKYLNFKDIKPKKK